MNKYRSEECCFISAIGRVEDSRIARLAAVAQSVLGRCTTIMPGARSSSSRHVPLPCITAYLWRDADSITLVRALCQRLRNFTLLMVNLLRLKPRVCVCVEPDSWIVAVLAKLLFRTTVIVDLQEFYTDRVSAFPRRTRRLVEAAIRWFMIQCARRTDLAIHVSEDRRAAYSWLPLRTETLFALYPPRVADVGGDPSRPRVLVHAGPLRPAYASFELLQAMEIVRRRHPDVQLLVFGGALGVSNQSEFIQRLTAEGVVQLRPDTPHEQVLASLPGCLLGLNLVLPLDTTHKLAQPRKLYEYMAAGLPVVGAAVPTIRRVLAENDCGIAVDAAVPEEIAAAILRIIEEPDLRARLGENGRRAVRDYFNSGAEERRLSEAIAAVSATGRSGIPTEELAVTDPQCVSRS